MGFKALAKLIVGFFLSVFNKSDAKQKAAELVASVTPEVQNMAVAAVEYAEGLVGLTGPEKKAAALEKLKENAASAGKDLSGFAASTLNWIIETALQVALSYAASAITK